MRNLLLCAFLFGAFASILAEGLSYVSTDGGPASVASANGEVALVDTGGDGSAEIQDNYQALGDRIEIERSADGHFYADVQVNGQAIRFLVDTGASGIALSREDARRAGLATSISMPGIVGQGASGDVHGEIVTLDRISMGSKEAEDVPAVVLDAGSHSLLGQSFLGRFDKVEIRGERMILQ